MGKFVDENYVAEFVVQDDLDTVWAKLQEETDGEMTWLAAFPRMPGFEKTAELIEKTPPSEIRLTKVSEPCKDSEITVTLAEAQNGTKVMVVQSGFPAYVKGALETFRIGGDQIVADLALFLGNGVSLSRHGMKWAFPGIVVQDALTGIEVAFVMPGSWGERLGLRTGDLIATVGGAPVFSHLEFQALMRVFDQGSPLACAWVRGDTLHEGEAAL